MAAKNRLYKRDFVMMDDDERLQHIEHSLASIIACLRTMDGEYLTNRPRQIPLVSFLYSLTCQELAAVKKGREPHGMSPLKPDEE